MNFFLNTNITIEPGAATDLKTQLADYQQHSVLCIYDINIADNRYFQTIKEQLEQIYTNIAFHENNLRQEPTYAYLSEVTNQHRDKKISLIIAIGGGSTIDIGKGTAICLTNTVEYPEFYDQTAKRYTTALSLKGFPENINAPIPLITIPSIVGSGAEISYNAVFIDRQENRKLGINNRKNFPIKTIIDPRLTSSAPTPAVLSSAMDTLVHCVDSFGSQKQTALSRMFSIEGFKRTFQVLLSKDLNSEQSHMELATGSICGITALMNSGDGPTNGFAYYLGVERKVPHGLAGAIFLLEVMKYNVAHGYEEYYLLNPKQDYANKKANCLDLLKQLDNLYKHYQIPNIAASGYNHDNVETLATAVSAALSGSFSGNPIPFNKQSAREVLAALI